MANDCTKFPNAEKENKISLQSETVKFGEYNIIMLLVSASEKEWREANHNENRKTTTNDDDDDDDNEK